MNNEKLGAAPQMYAGGDAKQAIEFAWSNRGSNFHCISPYERYLPPTALP